jgi:hypothetical protein
MTSLPVANFRWTVPTMGILCNFRMGMPTPFHPFGWPSVTGSHGNCTTTLVVIQNAPIAHAHTITSVHWRHFRWKGPTRGTAKLPVSHNILLVPDRASSGHVTSGCSPLFPHKYDFVRTHILLMYLHLNNWEFCSVKSENMTLFMLSLIFQGNVLFLCVALDKKCIFILILIFKSLGIHVWIISSMFHFMKTKKMLHKCQCGFLWVFQIPSI